MRILVIEDEPGILSFIKEGLQEEGFAVDTASDGTKGLEMALVNDGEYDLLLVDWMLPGVSGIEICRQVRKNKSGVPVIFLTAKDTIQDTVFALGMGANDYIKKPFSFEELLARIRVQLRGKDEETNRLFHKDLVMDLHKHQVFRADEEIVLTQKEFALLEFLLRNNGKVCTRTSIIEHVWDIHFDYDTSVIDVYINALRKKLDTDGKKSIIRTIRGVGYIVSSE
ncbi:MAG TPA: response regulator transcription factor [Bacteroidales bacterium]|nr:response regulator transcription factor [Bacteroidales bacterium]